MNLYPHTETISIALNDSRAASAKVRVLFDQYAALPKTSKDAFVLALIGELMVARARSSAPVSLAGNVRPTGGGRLTG